MPPVPRHWSSSFQVQLEDGVQNPDNAFSISASTVVYKRRQRNVQTSKNDIFETISSAVYNYQNLLLKQFSVLCSTDFIIDIVLNSQDGQEMTMYVSFPDF
jgi:hypothetical protein